MSHHRRAHRSRTDIATPSGRALLVTSLATVLGPIAVAAAIAHPVAAIGVLAGAFIATGSRRARRLGRCLADPDRTGRACLGWSELAVAGSPGDGGRQ